VNDKLLERKGRSKRKKSCVFHTPDRSGSLNLGGRPVRIVGGGTEGGMLKEKTL